MIRRDEFKSFAWFSLVIGGALAVLAARIMSGARFPPLTTVLMLLPVGWIVSMAALIGFVRWCARRNAPLIAGTEALERKTAAATTALARMDTAAARALVESEVGKTVKVTRWTRGQKPAPLARDACLAGLFDTFRTITLDGWDDELDASEIAAAHEASGWLRIGRDDQHVLVWVNQQTGKAVQTFDSGPEEDGVRADASIWHLLAKAVIMIRNEADSADGRD